MAGTSDVDETIRRITSHKGVLGVLIVNADGIPIRTTMENNISVQYASLLGFFTAKARSVLQKLEPTNELKFLRLRSLKHEIMVAPDNEYLLVIVQNPIVNVQ